MTLIDNHLRAASMGSSVAGIVLLMMTGVTPYTKACVVFGFVTVLLRCVLRFL